MLNHMTSVYPKAKQITLERKKFTSLSVSGRDELMSELKHQAFMASTDYLTSKKEDVVFERAIDRVNYRLNKMGLESRVPESVTEESVSDIANSFLEDVFEEIQINLSNTIASCFIIPVNAIATAEGQSQNSASESEYSQLKSDARAAKLPDELIAKLDNLNDQTDSKIEPGASYASNPQNSPILEWLEDVSQHLAKQRKSQNPLN